MIAGRMLLIDVKKSYCWFGRVVEVVVVTAFGY